MNVRSAISPKCVIQSGMERTQTGYTLKHQYLRYAAITIASLIALDALLVLIKWPFTRQREVESLEHFAQSDVTIQQFRMKFWLHPGFDAGGVVFMRRVNGRPVTLARVEHMECRSTWLNIFTYTHRVTRFDLRGVHVVIPDPVPQPMPRFVDRKQNTTVEHLTADGAILDVRNAHLQFPELRLSNIANGKSIGYQITAKIPKPASSVVARGNIGPFQSGAIQKLPLNGSFELRDGNLQSFDNLSGNLHGAGSFRGILSRLEISGEANIREFHLATVPNPVNISSQYNVAADCTHGSVQIRQATTRFAQTEVHSSGSVENGTLTLNMESAKARLEDLLALISAPARAAGTIQFHSTVQVPSGTERFLRRLRMAGEFHIEDGQLLSPDAQLRLDKLSARARSRSEKKVIDSKHPPKVTAHVDSKFDDQNGTVAFSSVVFRVPSATATAAGTFNLLSKTIRLHGMLAMRSSLSGAAGGAKGLLLLPLDPFFKKGSAGALFPIEVRGSYSHPVFQASLRRH